MIRDPAPPACGVPFQGPQALLAAFALCKLRKRRLNVGMRSVQDLGDELYALAPAAFTAARDSFVAQARERGDRTTATELAAMKRPTQGAWLVNLLALRQPDAVAELIDLGQEIRDAQGTVPPTQLRDLSARRRRALDAALGACTTLATEAGESAPTRAQLGEVETTLAAAMADETAAEVVRTGRVIKALRYSGFGDGFGATAPARSGGAPPASRAAAAGGRAAPGAPARPAADPEALQREAEQRRAAAQQRLDEAEQALAAAEGTERDANAEVERVTAEIARLRELLEAAQLDARGARQARLAAERAFESAQRRMRRDA
jgi:hypothetical protein